MKNINYENSISRYKLNEWVINVIIYIVGFIYIVSDNSE